MPSETPFVAVSGFQLGKITTYPPVQFSESRSHYLQGRLMMSQGQNDKALEEFSTAIGYKDWLVPPYFFKAFLLINRGDLDGAQNALQQVLKLDRRNINARASLAKVYAIQGKFQAALSESTLALQAQAGNEDALMAHAEALRGMGQLDQSKAEYLRLAEFSPKNPLYRHRLGWIEMMKGNSKEAIGQFKKSLELNAGFGPSLNDLLYVYTNAKQFAAALEELDRLAKIIPAQDVMHVLRGRIYMGQRNWESAVAEFQKAIDSNSHNYQAYLLMGQVHKELKNLPQAIKDIDGLIANNKQYAPAYLLKGLYLEALKDFPGAIDNYRESLKLDSNNPAAGNNLAWLLSETGKDLSEALAFCQAARKQDPQNPEIADTLGWLYYKQKNYVLAIDQLLFSVNNRTRPEAENYYRLGMAYYAKGDKALAKQFLRKALDLNSALPDGAAIRKILSSAG